MIFTTILHNELAAAGVNLLGCNSDGRVWDDKGDIEARADVAAIIAAHKATAYNVDEFGKLLATEVVFDVPVIAPDFQVGSPKPKDDPVAAMDDAEAESKKPRKSIALIALSLAQYAKHVEVRLKKGKI